MSKKQARRSPRMFFCFFVVCGLCEYWVYIQGRLQREGLLQNVQRYHPLALTHSATTLRAHSVRAHQQQLQRVNMDVEMLDI